MRRREVEGGKVRTYGTTVRDWRTAGCGDAPSESRNASGVSGLRKRYFSCRKGDRHGCGRRLLAFLEFVDFEAGEFLVGSPS